MPPLEHSAILSTFIKLPFVNKIFLFVFSIFEWLLKTGFTVFCFLSKPNIPVGPDNANKTLYLCVERNSTNCTQHISLSSPPLSLRLTLGFTSRPNFIPNAVKRERS